MIDRYCLKSASGKYVAGIVIVKNIIQFGWTDDMDEAVNVGSIDIAKHLAQVMQDGGQIVLPVKWCLTEPTQP